MSGTHKNTDGDQLIKALLQLCKRLESAWKIDDILNAYAPVATEILGYPHAWLSIFNERPGFVSVINFRTNGQESDTTRMIQNIEIPMAGDLMIEEIMRAQNVVVVDDARIDPRTNKEMVALIHNRTIINVPLVLVDQKIGSLGMGTIGDDEGVRPPQAWQLEFMQAMASHIAVAIDRVQFINARQKAEDALHASVEFANSLIHAMQDGFSVLDSTGKQTDVNPAFCKMTGFRKEELLHCMPPFPYWPVEETDRIQAALNDMLQGHFREYEFNFVRKNGERFPVTINPSVIRNKAGEIINYIATVKDISERKAVEDIIKFQATHDELTGLGNRRAFEHILNQLFDATRYAPHQHVLCYLDLDEFKVINDTCGHAAGDELLRQIANKFSSVLRADDHLCRIGGDEFGIILHHQSIEQALLIAERLQQQLHHFRFQWQDRSFAIGVSIGMVVLNEHSESVGALLQSADSACYVAKDAGRGRIHVYASDDPALAQRYGVMEWVSRIEKALAEDLFVLYAQAIVDTKPEGHQGLHCEFLLRMKDHHGGIIPPGAFMPAVERYHLSARVDTWVVKHALAWMKKHEDQIELCSINLSGQSLGDPHFLEFVSLAIESSGLACEKICFEITETSAIANITMAKNFMQQLSAKGCRFSLDDFGSGLSSFAYLRNLDVNILKIDGQFVRDIETNPINLAMVKSIHEIACLMGKKTVAEFVENREILALLQGIGVHYAQGFGLGMPVPADQLLLDQIN
ncbi:putative bifunctional diguanylate cyclase/phosphodiesterase [Undibacterium fentianense]|uniref:EAL domain-containing protein n=1 Tax=Undibacterium fentianense TaxID=2828728 RepID=A0A941E301_9BURK|nr:EAL domain-containing protein [Undibacterium fentianense]MBR7800051.1 EAL domain-containing protein [Undibacterium fentianense]